MESSVHLCRKKDREGRKRKKMSLQWGPSGQGGSPSAHLGHHLQCEIASCVEGGGAGGAQYIQYCGQVRPTQQ